MRGVGGARRPVGVFATTLVIVAAWALPAPASLGEPPAASANRSIAELQVVRSIRNDTSPPLRVMARARSPEVEHGLREIPLGRRPAVGGRGFEGRDPALPSVANTALTPPPLGSFEGVSNADNAAVAGGLVAPPDTNGDVGPNHYVQWNNISFAVWDKAGNLLLGPAAGNTLFSGFGGLCETTNQGDPIVLYDPLADRWFMSQFAFNRASGVPAGPFSQCIAVSQTPDPTGPYHRYDFLFSNTLLNDYPKFGVWPDAYYMTVNTFDASAGFAFAGVAAVAFERDQMLQGLPAGGLAALLPPSVAFGMLPADMDGSRPPPAGAPNPFVALLPPTGLQIFEFHVDFAVPANSTFTGPAIVPVSPFDFELCGFSFDCIPQPGTAQRVDAISGIPMHRAPYRNFGSHEAMVLNHTVDVGADQAGIRWHELRRDGGAWSLFQEGTHAPDSDHRWMGSIAMDGAGNIALGYSVSSSTTFPSIRYAGRVPGDPPGTMRQEATLIAGGGSQTGKNRWGDYSMMAVDPTDDGTFWYTQEYYAASSPFDWQTRIGSFKYTCPGLGQSGLHFVGTPLDDNSRGTPGDDKMCGFQGNDTLSGRGGNDIIDGGPGSDASTLKGGGGNDTILGRGGGDKIIGGSGNDKLTGHGGKDLLKGGPGGDVLNGGPGKDTCIGGPGKDKFKNCEKIKQ